MYCMYLKLEDYYQEWTQGFSWIKMAHHVEDAVRLADALASSVE
jgi:exopolysaccharide biosynthesis predicted pyruvyltransferase EpsI